MKTTLSALGYLVAGVLIVAGAGQCVREVHRSLYYDGGIAYSTTSGERITRSKPIQIGTVVMGWHGPACLLVGGFIAVAVWQLRRNRS